MSEEPGVSEAAEARLGVPETGEEEVGGHRLGGDGMSGGENVVLAPSRSFSGVALLRRLRSPFRLFMLTGGAPRSEMFGRLQFGVERRWGWVESM